MLVAIATVANRITIAMMMMIGSDLRCLNVNNLQIINSNRILSQKQLRLKSDAR